MVRSHVGNVFMSLLFSFWPPNIVFVHILCGEERHQAFRSAEGN